MLHNELVKFTRLLNHHPFNLPNIVGQLIIHLIFIISFFFTVVVFSLLLPRQRQVNNTAYTSHKLFVQNRTSLDVYGENVRKIVPIDSPQFGRAMAVCVGAKVDNVCAGLKKKW